jgi:hypothetical protein
VPDNEEPLEGIKVHDNVSNPKAPLVIDLPDGQKLLVGELPAGSVVEIATWRGTGRPDSRTTRLLLGVTNDEQPDDDPSANETGAAHVDMRSRSERRKEHQRKSKINLRSVVLPALVVGGLVFAFVISPLTIVNPTIGASIGFGSADSSLVITSPVDVPEEGQIIVAPLGETGEDIVMGRVSAIADQDVLIQTDTGFAQAKKNTVIGKVLVVIPFLGRIF